MKPRYLSVEAPDIEATVDFLSLNVSVGLRVVNGVLEVRARMSHGEDESTWDEHEAAWPLPRVM